MRHLVYSIFLLSLLSPSLSQAQKTKTKTNTVMIKEGDDLSQYDEIIVIKELDVCDKKTTCVDSYLEERRPANDSRLKTQKIIRRKETKKEKEDIEEAFGD